MSSPGILRQYLEDYSEKADAYGQTADAYNKTLVLGADGKPVLVSNGSILTKHADGKYYRDGGAYTGDPKRLSPVGEGDVSMVRQGGTANYGMVPLPPPASGGGYGDSREDNYTSPPPTGGYGDSRDDYYPSTPPASGGGYGDSREDYDPYPRPTHEYGITGYTYPDKPGEFKEPAPSFTTAQSKQLSMPDRSQVLAGVAKGTEGVISRFLARKQSEGD